MYAHQTEQGELKDDRVGGERLHLRGRVGTGSIGVGKRSFFIFNMNPLHIHVFVKDVTSKSG